jgi:hypothetical protein
MKYPNFGIAVGGLGSPQAHFAVANATWDFLGARLQQAFQHNQPTIVCCAAKPRYHKNRGRVSLYLHNSNVVLKHGRGWSFATQQRKVEAMALTAACNEFRAFGWVGAGRPTGRWAKGSRSTA